MARRRYYRRSRQRYTSHDLQDMLKKKTTPSTSPLTTNTESPIQETSHPSPESVLFGSQKAEITRCENLSPEIISKQSNPKSNLHTLNYETETLLSETKGKESKQSCNLEKTLSMNDDIKLEMNYDFGDESKKSGIDICNSITDFRSSTTQDMISYVSEPMRFETYGNQTESFGLQLYLNESHPRNQPGSIRRNKTEDLKSKSVGQSRYESKNEKIPGDTSLGRFSTNWSECRRIFSNLRQLHSFKINKQSNWFSKYKKLDQQNSVSNISYYSPSCSLPGGSNSEEKREESMEKETRREMRKKERIRERSTTPCRGSPPPAKRCRTTLNFNSKLQEERNNEFVTERNNLENFFSPNITIFNKTEWNGCSSDSSQISVLDLPAVSDSGQSCADIDRETEIDDRSFSGFLKNRRRRRFRFSKWPINKMSLFWIWIVKRLTSKKLRRTIALYAKSKNTDRVEELNEVLITLRKDNEQMIEVLLKKVERLSEELTRTRMNTETALSQLTTEISDIRSASKKIAENNDSLTQELKKLHGTLEDVRTKPCKESTPPPLPPPPPPPPPPLPPPPPPPAPAGPLTFRSPLQPVTPTTPSRTGKTPSRKCSTPLLNRPTITVEDLLKVTLKKAPQNNKDNRRNTIPGPRGPVVSLDMLRNVKLKSARRRATEQSMKSPRSPRMIKTRTAPSLSISPIMTVGDTSLGRILRQVDMNRRGPRRLLSTTNHSREYDFAQDNRSRIIDKNSSESNLQTSIA